MILSATIVFEPNYAERFASLDSEAQMIAPTVKLGDGRTFSVVVDMEAGAVSESARKCTVRAVFPEAPGTEALAPGNRVSVYDGPERMALLDLDET